MAAKLVLLATLAAILAVSLGSADTLTSAVETLQQSAEESLEKATTSVKKQSLKQVKTKAPGILKIAQTFDKQIESIDTKREDDVAAGENAQTQALNNWSEKQLERISNKAKCDKTIEEAEKLVNDLTTRYTDALSSCTTEINNVLDDFESRAQEASADFLEAINNLQTEVAACGESDTSDSTCRNDVSKQLRALSKPQGVVVRLSAEGKRILGKKYADSNCVSQVLKELKAGQSSALAKIRKMLNNEDDCDDIDVSDEDDDD